MNYTQNCVLNVHSTNVWATVNPYATRPYALQQHCSVNVNDFLIGLLCTSYERVQVLSIASGEGFTRIAARCSDCCFKWTDCRINARQPISEWLSAIIWIPYYFWGIGVLRKSGRNNIIRRPFEEQIYRAFVTFLSDLVNEDLQMFFNIHLRDSSWLFTNLSLDCLLLLHACEYQLLLTSLKLFVNHSNNANL